MYKINDCPIISAEEAEHLIEMNPTMQTEAYYNDRIQALLQHLQTLSKLIIVWTNRAYYVHLCKRAGLQATKAQIGTERPKLYEAGGGSALRRNCRRFGNIYRRGTGIYRLQSCSQQ